MMILFLPLSSFAYLDPGSGSMLFSAIVGIVATLFFVFRGLFYKIIDLPAHLYGRRTNKTMSHRIVFYSEGGQYWNVFLPIVRELNSLGVECLYISSNEKDPGLSCEMEHVETRYIGQGNQAFFTLNTLQADICIMTTPGLDVLQIKRSRGVKTYCHITHSAGGCSGYTTYGLDYYDVVLVGGDGDIKMIEEQEKLRGTRRKRIEIIGCTYLDILRERIEELSLTNSPFENLSLKTILLSPTWGKDGLLSKYDDRILNALVGASKFNIIIRPHPQSFVSEKDMLKRLKRKYPESGTLKWDDASDGLEAMYLSDLMVSDYSGIVFDFLFLFGKPVITFKGQYDKRGKNSMDYSKEPWYIEAIDRVGNTIDEEDIDSLPERIDRVLAEQPEFNAVLSELRGEMDRHPGESGRRGTEIILDIARSLSSK